MDDEEDYDFLFPEAMMLPGEKRKVSGYLGVMDKEDAARSALPHTVSYALRYQRSAKYESARTKLKHFSAEVLKRELGLELYMVVHIQREGGHEAKFQALELDLMQCYGPGRVWAWRVEGRALRKDGTIGSKGARITFGLAKVYRRKLDGSWVRLGLNNAPHA